MNKLSGIWSILLFAAISLVFISCDFLLPAPLGRNNPNDNETQIGRFIGTVSDTNSIITYWDWNNALPAIDSNRVIDKIRIVHAEKDKPVSMYPVDTNSVVEYSENMTWNYIWSGLTGDMDHFFALYAHEKGGTWLAPRSLGIYLDGFVKDNTFIFNSFDGVSPYTSDQFRVFRVQETPFGILDVSNSTAPGFLAGDIIIINFNIYESVYFDRFLINLSNLTAPASDMELIIYAIKNDLDTGFLWADLVSENTIDYDFFITRPFTIAGSTYQTIDISEIANRMALFFSSSIAIKLNGPFDVDVSLWSIDTHYWGGN